MTFDGRYLMKGDSASARSAEVGDRPDRDLPGSRRVRIRAGGTPRAADLDARCRDLEARLRVSQAENESLTGKAEDVLLLGLVAGAIGRCEDPAEILATVLERVSVLKDISYCAFVEPEGAGLVIRHECTAFAAGWPTGAVLQASEDKLEDFVGAGHGPREWFLPADALSIPGGGLAPASVMMLSSSPDDGPLLLFLAADQRRTAAQMAALLPLLWQVLGMARARIAYLDLVRRLGDLFPGPEPRVGERTADLRQAKESEARFEFLAQHDPLTGLPNRLLFTARGEHALARSRCRGGRLAVMFLGLDLDRFAPLDDTLGHPAGDGLLRKVAERLTCCVRAYDTVGRLGGDELTVLLEELSDPGGAGAVARKILDTLAAPFSLGGKELFITVSIGVSVFPEDGDDLTTLMKQAASAMHRAKEQARGSLQFYTAELTRTAVERFRLESGLRQALRQDELVLHFQPQVSVQTGRIVGVEALVRWRHPDLGLLLPAQFIPLAEATGLVEGIGLWVLRAACRQVCAWMAAGLPSLRVAVNLSAQELSTSLLTERIAAALAETGLDPGLLEIEITETSVMANLEVAVGALGAVKALGVSLALDDFGTGYSSLSYLRRFPIDRLKMDGSFIRQIAHDETDQAIARAAIELGHGLRLAVVAEGVESPAQLEFLRANGCDAYQGHLFAAALPPEEVAALLRGAPCRA